MSHFDWSAKYYDNMRLKDVQELCSVGERPGEQVNFIKMRIQGIWDYPDQDKEVGAKHINDYEMFQMTFREPMEPIDKEVGDLGDLEDVLESDHTQETMDHTVKKRGTIQIKE